MNISVQIGLLDRFGAICLGKVTRCVTAAALMGMVSGCAAKSTTSPSIDNKLAERQMDQGWSTTAPSRSADNQQRIAQWSNVKKDMRTTLVADSARSTNALGLEVREWDGGTQLVVSTNAKTGTSAGEMSFQISTLQNPNRIVVDLMDGGNRESESFLVASSDVISNVRIGRHPDKSRVVVDLQEGQTVQVDGENVDGKIVISMATPAQLAKRLAPLTVETSPAQQLSSAVETSDVSISEMKEMPSSVPVLRELRFVDVGNGRKVMAQFDAVPTFELSRTAPSEYVLKVEGASFDGQNVATIVSPPGSGAIRSVRPVISGSDTLVRIFVVPGAEIDARIMGNAISIESNAPFYNSPDARAQAEIETGTDAEITPISPVTANASGLEGDLAALLDESPRYTGRLISLDLQDTDIDNALRIIAEVSNLNIIASDDVTGKVTLRLIDVPWDQALDVILKTNGLDKVLEGNVMRIAPIEKLRQERESLKQARVAEEDLEPMTVRFVRVSYAKASELRALVETVITERGTVSYDERTNQLIVKDIRRGVADGLKLIEKLDLRTPQVLLETQIVEAQRSFFRELGSELGFNFVRSPETGNATGYNFPNSVGVGGSVNAATPGVGSSFPAATSLSAGSAISLLLDSADGTRSLDYRLSALENEGRVRIVSRPSVATTNNQQAIIKSVEKIRVKTPSGGLSVATGANASANGGGGVATETIEIGIILEVTPQASPDYFVLLDINAKSSTLGSTVVEGIPSEVERSATSTVLVSSDQTFAMGGIYKITDRDTISGVPFLKDIPFLGHLFRRSNVDNRDEELIFFITPRIVEGSFDDAAMKMSS